MICFGTFPLRKPGILTWFEMLRYARSRSLANSSAGTSIVSLTVCLSVFSTVVCMWVQASREPGMRPRRRRLSLRSMYELRRRAGVRRELADRAGEIAMSFFRNDLERHVEARPDPGHRGRHRSRGDGPRGARRRFPDDASAGRKAGSRAATAGCGSSTRSTARRTSRRGIPIWATLMALQVDGEQVLGLVNAPALGERYEAVGGGGATWNGDSIRVSDVGIDGRALVVFGDVERGPDGRSANASTRDRRRSGPAGSATSGATCWWRGAPRRS